MNIGSLVRLSETAKISMGIDDALSDTLAVIIDRIDLTPMFDLAEESVIGYKVLVPGMLVEIVYEADIIEINDE